jgi:hypothetical protein
MVRHRAWALGLGLIGWGAACGPRHSSPTSTGAGGSRDAGGDSGAADADAALDSHATVGCARFGFVASGRACGSGCSFSCTCPGAFPKSIASCSPDGCLVAADCAAVCAEDLGKALSCAQTYTIAPPGGGGSGGAGGGAGGSGGGGAGGGSGGAGGSGLSPPMCAATDVNVPPSSAARLGNAAISGARLLGDETGALYLAGVAPAASSVDFGGGALPSGKRLVLWKLGPDHQHVWSRRFGTMFGPEDVSVLSFASNGDILMGGITPQQTDLGAGPEPAATAPQIYVVRYDRAGKLLARYLLPTSNAYPSLVSVVEGQSGELLVFGNFGTPFTAGATTLTPAGPEQNIFVVRFSAAGAVLEAKQYGRARNDLVFDAVGGADGSVYVLGFAYYAVDFGNTPLDLGASSSSYVVKLDATLSPVWQKLVGGANPRRAFLDATTLVVAGDSTSTVFYGDAATGALGRGNVFVLRIDASNGALVRGNAYEQKGSGAAVKSLGRFPDGGVAVGGYLRPPANFGGADLTGPKLYEPFVARYDKDGLPLWSTLFCSTYALAPATVSGIARDGDSPVLLVSFSTDLELGSQRLQGSDTVLLDMPTP